MLLRNLRPGVRRIQRAGEPATGVVTAVRAWPAGTIGISRATITVQARLPDGRTAEVKRFIDSHEFAGHDVSAGDELPLRYDPRNGGLFEIDYAAFRARQADGSRRPDAETPTTTTDRDQSCQDCRLGGVAPSRNRRAPGRGPGRSACTWARRRGGAALLERATS